MEFKVSEQTLNPIEWNAEEIKAEVSAKMEYYNTVVYTEDQIKVAKEDRATLNKFVKSIEDKRKEVKKVWMQPYTDFENQVKDVLSLINQPINLIDTQIKTFEEEQKTKKSNDIRTLFNSMEFPDWVYFEGVFDSKWLNASVTMKKVEEELQFKLDAINTNISMLESLPEISFEAVQLYKQTLDYAESVRRATQMNELRKQREADEEMKKKAIETVTEELETLFPDIEPESVDEVLPTFEDENIEVYLHLTMTADKKEALKEYCKVNGIEWKEM